MSFIINDNFTIKRIQTLDIIEERLKDELVETDYEKQAADFAMMSFEFAALIRQLMNVFSPSITIKESLQLDTQKI